jgi:hypothetical protein
MIDRKNTRKFLTKKIALILSRNETIKTEFILKDCEINMKTSGMKGIKIEFLKGKLIHVFLFIKYLEKILHIKIASNFVSFHK